MAQNNLSHREIGAADSSDQVGISIAPRLAQAGILRQALHRVRAGVSAGLRTQITIEVRPQDIGVVAEQELALDRLCEVVRLSYPAAEVRIREIRRRPKSRGRADGLPIKIPTGRMHSYDDG